MFRTRSSARTLAVLAALTLSLTACAGDGAAAPDGSEGSSSGSTSGEPTGTVILDGAELGIHNIDCLQPPVMDGRWRIFVTLKDGDFTLDEEGKVSGVVEGVTWLKSSGDDNTNIVVGESGATGHTTLHPSGHDTLTVDDTALLEVNITC